MRGEVRLSLSALVVSARRLLQSLNDTLQRTHAFMAGSAQRYGSDSATERTSRGGACAGTEREADFVGVASGCQDCSLAPRDVSRVWGRRWIFEREAASQEAAAVVA